MTIKYLRWTPDTCGCTIIESYDTDFPTAQTLKGHSVENACDAHKNMNIKDAVEHHAIVLEECGRKNLEHGKIGIDKEIAWEFDSKRTLHVYHQGKKVAEVAKR